MRTTPFALAQLVSPIALIALFSVMLVPVAPRLWQLWTAFDEAYGYVLLLLPLTVIAIVKAPRRADVPARQGLRWLLMLVGAGCSLLWASAALVGLELLHSLLLPVIFWCAWGACFGAPAARACLGPALMLYFIFPVWDPLGDHLVNLTSVATGYMVREWTPITAHIYGNHIALPSGSLVIANGCSGLRYLVVGLILCSLGARQHDLAPRWTILVLLLGTCVSLVANWVRVFLITLVAYYSQMQSSLVSNHEMLGWVLFFVMYAPLLMLLHRLPSSNSAIAIVDKSVPNNAPANVLATLMVLMPGLLVPWLAEPPVPSQAVPAPVALGASWKPVALSMHKPDGRLQQYVGAGGQLVDVMRDARYWPGPGEEALSDERVFADARPWNGASEKPIPHMQLIPRYRYGAPALAVQWFRVGPIVSSKRAVARALQLLLPLHLAPAVEEFWAVIPCSGTDCSQAAELFRGMLFPVGTMSWQPSDAEND